KDSRPDCLVVPTGSGSPHPMIRWQRVDFVEPAAETLNNVLSRPLEAGNAHVGCEGNRLLDVGQIEGGHVTDDRLLAKANHSSQSLSHFGWPHGSPRQERTFFVRNPRFGLPTQERGQRTRAAAARTYSQTHPSLVHFIFRER